MIQDCKIIYDTTTKEYLIVNLTTNESVPVGMLSKSNKSAKKSNQSEAAPQVKLEENKLVINTPAQEALQIKPGDSVSVTYQEFPGTGLAPIIANSVVMGSTGNKLTKSGTVSFRGANNAALKAFGSVFSLSKEGTFYRLLPINDTQNKLTISVKDLFKDPDTSLLDELQSLASNPNQENNPEAFGVNDLAELIKF